MNYDVLLGYRKASKFPANMRTLLILGWISSLFWCFPLFFVGILIMVVIRGKSEYKLEQQNKESYTAFYHPAIRHPYFRNK